jgi:hypothetical protein
MTAAGIPCGALGGIPVTFAGILLLAGCEGK